MNNSSLDTSVKNLPPTRNESIVLDLEQPGSDDKSGEYRWSGHSVSKSLIAVLMTACVSVSVIIFSMVQLISTTDPNQKLLYATMLSSTTAVWMPSPLSHLKKK